jgi:hypothetical protein
MAIIHDAQIRPTKLELVADWLPRQPWYPDDSAPELEQVGAYRFDDPDGEVGIETLLVRTADGPVLQVPMTYRGQPLPDGEPHLVGTMEHSVLGSRWVYDACGDPVYAAALAATVLRGGTGAEELLEADGGQQRREPSVAVTGSGGPDEEVDPVDEVTCTTASDLTVIRAGDLELTVRRSLDSTVAAGSSDGHTLMGTWAGQEQPVLLATVRRG